MPAASAEPESGATASPGLGNLERLEQEPEELRQTVGALRDGLQDPRRRLGD